MKKETIDKIVNIAVSNMCFGLSRHVERVNVMSDTAKIHSLASSISNVIVYQDCRFYDEYKEDIIISYTEYDNSLNLYTTVHDKTNKKVLGYSYRFCVRMNGKNQLEIACELCQALAMISNEIKY